MNAARSWEAEEPHLRREFAVPCAFDCGRMVLDIAGSYRLPICAECKEENKA